MNSTEDEIDPFYDPRTRTLYFSSRRGGNLDIFASQRSGPRGSFAAPSPVDWANTSANDSRFELSPDGFTAIVASQRAPTSGSKLFISMRSDDSPPFKVWSMLHAASGGDEYDPHFGPDGLTLYYGHRPSAQLPDIRFVRRATATDSTFDAPVTLAPISQPDADEGNPSITADGSVLVYSRCNAAAQCDIWYALRDPTTGEFGAGQSIPNLATSGGAEREPFVSRDGCEIFHARPVQDRGWDLYLVEVLP